MISARLRHIVALFGGALCLSAQHPVTISVDVSSSGGAWKPAWTFFGYDEPNYTYAKNGRKLLAELAAASRAPVYIRAHNLLTSGNGIPALKWGSTNAYTERDGRPAYDWKILDRIFDTFHQLKLKPLVEIGFMPEALSTHSQPYQHTFPNGPIWTGWAYPPKDYGLWADLVYRWVRHEVDRYGAPEVDTWYWEVWNEPDIGYWQGTPEEYYKLYDYTADAVKRALPTARIGGPHSTGPASQKAGDFLRGFLNHVVNGRNFVTGKTGAPLDYIGFHAKGSPRMVDGHVQMGIRNQALNIDSGFRIVASFPELRDKPVIIGESDPEGCAACSARANPQNGYRNGPLYASYEAAVYRYTRDLAERHRVRLEGAVTWAFEFEDQPMFEGFRELATNGVDKPVLNVFRMLGRMGGEQAGAKSDGAVDLDTALSSGVRVKPDIDSMATRKESSAAILVWNYHDDDVDASASPVRVHISGLSTAGPCTLRHYRIDGEHSNSYAVWKRMGSPRFPTPSQLKELSAAGQLEMIESPRKVRVTAGTVDLQFKLPRQAVSLLELAW